MTTHNKMTGQDIHGPISFVFADETARLVTTNPNTDEAYTTDDIGKEAWQTDDDTFYCLTSITPAWVEKGSSGDIETLYNSDQTMSAIDRVVDWTNDGSYDLTTYDVTTSDWTKSSGITADSSAGVSLNYLTGDGAGSTTTTNSIAVASAMTVTDGENSKGLVYAADYSTNYTDRSLVDKAYVDAQAGTEYTFSNGLTDTADVITLGGTVTQNILLTPDTDETYNFTLGSSAKYMNDIKSYSYSTYFESYDGSTSSIEMSLDGADFLVRYWGGGSNISSIGITSTAMTITDQTNTKGLVYAADYSGSYTDRSLVDKAYVDDNSGGDTLYSADGTLAGIRNVFQASNDLTFYKGSSDSSNENVTIHGDGSHSTYDPYLTLHEGFKTGNGSNSQALITNFGKANQVQFNDGTASTSTFQIASIVNGSDVFQHMETSFQGIQHEYVDIKKFNWYFHGTSTSDNWSIYDSSDVEIFNLNYDASVSFSTPTDSTGSFDVGTSSKAYSTIDLYADNITSTGLLTSQGNVGIGIAASSSYSLYVSSEESHVNITSTDGHAYFDLVSENNWRFLSEESGATTDGSFALINVSDTLTVLTVSPSGDLSVEGDVTANNVFSLVPSTIVGRSLGQTVTDTDAQVGLTEITVDGADSDYDADVSLDTITFTNGDGARIYEVSVYVRYDVQDMADTGSARSYGVLTPRLDMTTLTDYESWSYIREFQGGTNGTGNDGTGMTFQIQPAAGDELDFVVRGVTDTDTITDFEVDGIVVTVKRLS